MVFLRVSFTKIQFLFLFHRVQIKAEGRKRKLIIKDCKVTDAGNYSCMSNADKTEAEIVINCKLFLSNLILGIYLQN